MRALRWWLVIAAVSLIAWLYWHAAPVPPVIPPASVQPAWGPGKNVFDCETDTAVRPLEEFDEVTRARVLELLRQACRELMP